MKEEINENGKLEYLYYPEKNVYYSPANKLFYYSIDGAKSWDSVVTTSDNEPDHLGEKVVLETDKPGVFLNNAEHRKLYSGVLFNVGANASAVLATAEVSERKVIKKKKIATTKTEDEQKPKKGLGKLIDKVFGKRNKK